MFMPTSLHAFTNEHFLHVAFPPLSAKLLRMSTPREHTEQTHLATWLSAALPFGTWTTTANGFLRSTQSRKSAAQQGVLFGLPDVLIFLHPPCWIELKRQDGTQSDVEPRQRLVQKQLTDVCGMPGIVAFGADEAIAYVRQRYPHIQQPQPSHPSHPSHPSRAGAGGGVGGVGGVGGGSVDARVKALASRGRKRRRG